MAVEQVARNSYGKLRAILSARSHDIAAAEDALGDALCAALKNWSQEGIPDKPEAWLLTVARRRLIDDIRHVQVHMQSLPTLLALIDEMQEVVKEADIFPDERLKLLFICAHPAIDAGIRTPLMLQTVLGLDIERIASAFLVQPSAMAQRLARAKTKIRGAGISFELHSAKELPERVDAVLNAIYAVYGNGWEDVAGADMRREGLTMEAIGLGRLLAQLLPDEPEAYGLLAFMLYCEARNKARRSEEGRYVPLSEQDVRLWSEPMLREAEQTLESAARFNTIKRFQLEAAIQSVHAQRAQTGVTNWEAVALLHEGLVRIAPTIGALVSRAAAVAEARDATTAWALLEEISDNAVKNYQPYWALAAYLLKRMQRFDEAAGAYSRAIGLCEDQAMREFLVQQAALSSALHKDGSDGSVV